MSEQGDPFQGHHFVVPVTQVDSAMDMDRWVKSSGYEDYLGFVTAMNTAVKGKKLSYEFQLSDVIKGLLKLLETLDKWINEIAPTEQPQRFGNKAFRVWFKRLESESVGLTRAILPEYLHRAAAELSEYLVGGFGNPTRIDYGTGHEMSFACYLCCFYKLRLLVETDKLPTVFKVFDEYMKIVRKLQITYRMEPAGSRGVYGLDDYQFLPFIWGSSQFYSHPTILPAHFVDDKIVAENRSDFMFLECIKYITSVKTGPFAEHSNALWNVSGVAHWGKVNSGLIKMYKAEVLQKFPIIQHFKFGSILTLEPAARPPPIRL